MSRSYTDVVKSVLGHTHVPRPKDDFTELLGIAGASRVDATLASAMGVSSVSTYMTGDPYFTPSLDQIHTGPVGSLSHTIKTKGATPDEYPF